MMRQLVTLLLLSSWMVAQTTPQASNTESTEPQAGSASTAPALVTTQTAANPNSVLVPAGTKLALELKHAISTKGTQEGAAVYAETTFPFALNDRILIPAGTYVQGRISHIERGGHIKGRAEVLMHFTTLIFPSGYTVVLPGALDNAPGIDKTNMKDKEGTLQQDSQAGDEATKIATSAAGGAVVGGLSRGVTGGVIGAGAGGAIGTAVALLGRNRDVIMPAKTTFEMIIQRDVTLDPNRIAAASK
jgi:hypothetical protein